MAANTSILALFERMWQHVIAQLNNKSDASHAHDAAYDSKGSANTALESANAYTDSVVASKTQVQMITWEDDD